jgi:hypothetical protein
MAIGRRVSLLPRRHLGVALAGVAVMDVPLGKVTYLTVRRRIKVHGYRNQWRRLRSFTTEYVVPRIHVATSVMECDALRQGLRTLGDVPAARHEWYITSEIALRTNDVDRSACHRNRSACSDKQGTAQLFIQLKRCWVKSLLCLSERYGYWISRSDRSFRLWIPTTIHERGKMGLK